MILSSTFCTVTDMMQTLFMLDRYKYNQFDISSIHIYSVDLLSACCMSGSVPGGWEYIREENRKRSLLLRNLSSQGRQDNKLNKEII